MQYIAHTLGKEYYVTIFPECRPIEGLAFARRQNVRETVGYRPKVSNVLSLDQGRRVPTAVGCSGTAPSLLKEEVSQAISSPSDTQPHPLWKKS